MLFLFLLRQPFAEVATSRKELLERLIEDHRKTAVVVAGYAKVPRDPFLFSVSATNLVDGKDRCRCRQSLGFHPFRQLELQRGKIHGHPFSGQKPPRVFLTMPASRFDNARFKDQVGSLSLTFRFPFAKDSLPSTGISDFDTPGHVQSSSFDVNLLTCRLLAGHLFSGARCLVGGALSFDAHLQCSVSLPI